MNNRMAVGLAVSAGYALGRTKKARPAFGLTTLVLGRKPAPDAAAVASFPGGRLGDNPQLKDIREQLRTDWRGVGSAAVSAVVDRGLEAVADRLHDQTPGSRRAAPSTGRSSGRTAAKNSGEPAPRRTAKCAAGGGKAGADDA